MRNLFIGMIFVFLNFNLTFNNCVIGLLPDFIGFFFIMKGLRDLEGTSMHFNMVESLTKGIMVYSAITYAMDLLGLAARMGVLALIMGLALVAGRLYVSYHVVLGVCDLEKESGYRMDSDVLLFRWKIMAILNVCSILFLMIPFVNLIYIFVNFIFGVLYLAAFNKSANAYVWLDNHK